MEYREDDMNYTLMIFEGTALSHTIGFDRLESLLQYAHDLATVYGKCNIVEYPELNQVTLELN